MISKLTKIMMTALCGVMCFGLSAGIAKASTIVYQLDKDPTRVISLNAEGYYNSITNISTTESASFNRIDTFGVSYLSIELGFVPGSSIVSSVPSSHTVDEFGVLSSDFVIPPETTMYVYVHLSDTRVTHNDLPLASNNAEPFDPDQSGTAYDAGILVHGVSGSRGTFVGDTFLGGDNSLALSLSYAVPEPSSALLMGLGTLSLCLRRKRI